MTMAPVWYALAGFLVGAFCALAPQAVERFRASGRAARDRERYLARVAASIREANQDDAQALRRS